MKIIASSNDSKLSNAVRSLDHILSESRNDKEITNLIQARDEVLTRYQKVFSKEGINNLTAEDFRDFLMFRNNKHWTGLQRMGPQTTQDMNALRKALHELIDETSPIQDRINSLLPGGKAKVHKLGKAIITPILMITNPEKYGVWNGITEGAMQELNVWPDFERKMSIGDKYIQLNNRLLDLSHQLDIDLWTLDSLWWAVNKSGEGNQVDEIEAVEEQEGTIFGLERHLHDFLLDNWEQTELAIEWELVEEGGDIKGYGYERPTEVGRIDLLAHHKSKPKWLVIELKRAQTSDDTVGQVLRYMGWVTDKLAETTDSVEGLIIGLYDDQKLKYALSVIQNVRFMVYQVEFKLISTK